MRNLLLVTTVAFVAACGLLGDVARTANDVAGDLCALHFSENPDQIPLVADAVGAENPDELGAEELCAIHAVLEPFIEQVVSSGEEAADSLKRPGA